MTTRQQWQKGPSEHLKKGLNENGSKDRIKNDQKGREEIQEWPSEDAKGRVKMAKE